MVAVVGCANVGKSTLVNRICGEKISIVSSVVQTTRNIVRGIFSEDRGQLVFLDTPGVHKARHDLGRLMNKVARNSAEGADVVLLMLDSSRRPRDEDEGWMTQLLKNEAPPVLVLNKSDRGNRHAERYRRRWNELCAERGRQVACDWHVISASAGAGVPELVTALFGLVPRAPLLFPADMVSDFPRRLHMADVIREKLLPLLRKELPHAIAVRVTEIDEETEDWNVSVALYVDRPSQKGIVIGHKGRLLRKVRRQAEAELSEAYERRIQLALRVKVEQNWAKKHWILKELGYLE